MLSNKWTAFFWNFHKVDTKLLANEWKINPLCLQNFYGRVFKQHFYWILCNQYKFACWKPNAKYFCVRWLVEFSHHVINIGDDVEGRNCRRLCRDFSTPFTFYYILHWIHQYHWEMKLPLIKIAPILFECIGFFISLHHIYASCFVL